MFALEGYLEVESLCVLYWQGQLKLKKKRKKNSYTQKKKLKPTITYLRDMKTKVVCYDKKNLRP